MTPPDRPDDIFLLPGGHHFGSGHTRIRTILGSCVSITMWHPQRRIGGMCHYMLARPPSKRKDGALDGRYGEDALKLFLAYAIRHGAKPQDFEFKLFGAASMFAASNGFCEGNVCGAKAAACPNVPCVNAHSGRSMLARHGLNVVSEDLGGLESRSVIFEIATGEVLVRRSQPVP